MENLAIFLDEQLNEIGTKKFDSTDEFITYKKGTFNIRLDAFLYRNKNTTYYAYIYPTDEKLLLDITIEPVTEIPKEYKEKKFFSVRITKIKEKLEKGDLKLIVGESIIGQLARMAIMGLKTNWVLIIIIAVAVGIGAGGAGYTFGHDSGLNSAKDLINATISLNPSVTVVPTVHPTPNYATPVWGYP